MVSSKCCQVLSPSPFRFLAALMPPWAQTECERLTGTMENRSTAPPASAILMTAASPARPPPTTMILGAAMCLPYPFPPNSGRASNLKLLEMMIEMPIVQHRPFFRCQLSEETMRTRGASLRSTCLKPVDVACEAAPLQFEIPVIAHHVALVRRQALAHRLVAQDACLGPLSKHLACKILPHHLIAKRHFHCNGA